MNAIKLTLLCMAACTLTAKEMPEKAAPCSSIGYNLYGEVLFLQPNGSNLYFAVQAHPFDSAITTHIVSPNWFEYEFSPAYHPGFEVGAELLFKNMNMKLTANWEWLHGDDRASQSVTPATMPMIGPIFDIGPNSAEYKDAKATAQFRFDAANLLLSKKVCFGKNLFLNMFAGGTFTRIRQTISSYYSNDGGTVARSITNPSIFTGGGSQFGVDFDFRVAGNFFFTGASSVSMIMGQLQNSTTYKSWTPYLATLGDPQPNVQTTTVPNRSQLVPGFEEKLGFSYDFPFHCGVVSLKAGYQFQIYLNAVQSFDMISQVLPSLLTDTPDVGLFAVAYQRTLSNFILTGPYVNLNVEF